MVGATSFLGALPITTRIGGRGARIIVLFSQRASQGLSYILGKERQNSVQRRQESGLAESNVLRVCLGARGTYIQCPGDAGKTASQSGGCNTSGSKLYRPSQKCRPRKVEELAKAQIDLTNTCMHLLKLEEDLDFLDMTKSRGSLLYVDPARTSCVYRVKLNMHASRQALTPGHPD